MSIWRLVMIECDGLDCDKHFNSTSDDYDQAVRDAARMGWTRDDDTDCDYCPNHGGA